MALRGVLRTGTDRALLFYCPGCNTLHRVHTGGGFGPRWGFNDDYDRPTFTPSVHITGVRPLTDDEYVRTMAGEVVEPERTVCHSFVTDGMIQFLPDSTHDLAGQTVRLTKPPE